MSKKPMFAVMVLVALSAVSDAQETQQRELEAKKVKVRGTEIAYIEQGEGEPVLLLHGALLDYRSWLSQMGPLSKRYRVIAFSRRYHWPNVASGDGAEYTPATHVADVVAFIEVLKLGRVHLVGHSGGGGVSLRVAREHPQLVWTVVLGEGPSIPPPGGPPPPRPEFAERLRAAFEQGDMERGVQIWLDGTFGEGFYARMPDERRRLVLDNAPSMKAALASRAGSRGGFTCEEVRTVKAPTLVLVGERSDERFQRGMQNLLSCLSGAEKAVVPEAGHGLQLDNPAGFSEIVVGFLARHSESVVGK